MKETISGTQGGIRWHSGRLSAADHAWAARVPHSPPHFPTAHLMQLVTYHPLTIQRNQEQSRAPHLMQLGRLHHLTVLLERRDEVSRGQPKGLGAIVDDVAECTGAWAAIGIFGIERLDLEVTVPEREGGGCDTGSVIQNGVRGAIQWSSRALKSAFDRAGWRTRPSSPRALGASH